MKLSPEKVRDLQASTPNVRNICILAHVDHGKTSLSDSLLATNGIISQRMAGKVRYLDSREDEQLRGITMESSAISLYFKVMRKKEGSNSDEAEVKEHLINLIDSPGHIDFSSEVSTASRLCDGAVVLVDVVEGVCSQTVNVLRQCWVDRLKPILVLNKMDRLVNEWRFSPLEAYQHISRLVEQVNSVIGSFYAGDRMEDDMKWRESGAEGEYVERSDSDLYFSPESNNVIFASAVDGWAFSINTFARIYSAKLGFSHAVLSKTLWGDFYLDMKNKKIIPGNKLKSSQASLKPLFVSLVLEQIWNIYDACLLNRDDEKLEKITSKLGSKLSPRDLRSTDYKSLLNLIMSQWIPLSHALLGAVIEYLPNPSEAQQQRMEKILDECIYSAVPETPREELLDESFKKALEACDASDPESHTLAYVSKMLSVPNAELPKEATVAPSAEELQERSRKAREIAKKASDAAAALADARLEEEDGGEIYLETKPDQFQWEFEEDPDEEEEETEVEKETLVAFTRVYSGTLIRGQSVCIVGPKYDPALGKDHPSNIEQFRENVVIQDLLLIMGREFVRVGSVPAGNIVGLIGLGDLVLKNATIMSELPEGKPYLNFASTATLIHNKPIMRVAIEPDNLLKLHKLEKGLDLLTKADPVLEWYIDDDSGELIVCVAGELHLERCLKDLETRFAPGCDVVIKEPVIPFREGLNVDAKPSITKEELEEASDAEEEEVEEDEVDLQIEVYPLPDEVTNFLTKSEHEIKDLVNSRLTNSAEEFEKHVALFNEKFLGVLEEHTLPREVLEIFSTAKDFINNVISFGPKRVGANVFVEDPTNGQQFRRALVKENEEATRFEFESNVLGGFQLAMNEGPLCSEPVQGTIVVLKRTYRPDTEEVLLNLAGRILKQTRQLIHKGFLLNAPRLFLAMYTCEIQTSPEVLGKVYVVIQKRGGSIISEEMKEGTPFFTINARIPVVEAFGFSEEIRKRTSGAASPQLVFDGFDMLDIDPFWVPHTEEELEELGTFAERENVARRYMNNIRRRKGLFVDEKVVKNAEKQRTLKKD
ncbi:hypothetical protein FT663_02809 [Candidozyma haemuli var. vulneris]|uniref:Ribosome assembly protein 1 n=1 Tax=Candidozyma haemuli TaxID=45357 RepID=A0A2V1AXS6_9ASCO|nr:hypothetical protein CXQ85_005219 [[Candida] haemuloni]KAF3991308.1 hypothetical protein FT663_02809 [[Candida] haemuloni var. vulneris]KAF3991994.1 hypothetical protein FT662_01447 [[Candida] haemuloni var. vulneris]PVH22645.1 hypothetical protein CXQ85_005219 [[Candida] haemuloni]